MAKGQQRKNKEVKKPKKQPTPVKLSDLYLMWPNGSIHV